jgi:hypothetical protein
LLRRYLITSIGVLCLATISARQLPSQLSRAGESVERRADSIAVSIALRRFLVAFDNLEWAPFRAAFSDSATIFHPAPDMAERVVGPEGIDSTFRAVFADIRTHSTGGPPYQRLDPAELRIQPLVPGLVLVTFELRNSERLGRRTIVFRQEGTTWRIFHLHASNVPR